MKRNLYFLLIFIILFGCNKTKEDSQKSKATFLYEGIEFYNQGLFNKAIESYEKAINVDPKYVDAYNNMGLAYADKSNYDRALKCYLKAIEIKPDCSDSYYNMGLAFYEKVNYDKSIDSFQKAIDINPEFIEAYYNMGNTYYLKKNYDKAIECYRRVIKIEPETTDAYCNMAFAYNRKGLNVSAADFFYQAGLLYLKQNNKQRVLDMINQMITLTPESLLIQKLMDKLDKIKKE